MREVKSPPKKLIENFSEHLDSFLGIFSPHIEYKRRMYRFANKFALRGGYTGARKDRLHESWSPTSGSADEDLLPDLATLREKSRDLNRNDAIASGITGTMNTNIIGSGIQPQSRIDRDILKLTPEAAETLQKQAERCFRRWAPFADSQNRMAFWEMQHLIQRQILENGEVVIIPEMIDEVGRPFFFALNVIESDRLDTPSDKRMNKNFRKGVEIGSRGQPVAYWICKTHPGDITYRNRAPDSKEYIRYPAKNQFGRPGIMHLYWLKRPGQSRGEPFFAPVINKFKDLAEYAEAELVAARVAACFAVFIEQGDPVGAAFGRTTQTDVDGKRIETLEPGIIQGLKPGEKVSTVNPGRPGAQFDPFVDKVLRFIGASLGLPYELVIKDFSKTTYSSARAAILEARKFFIYQQKWMADKLCQPTWQMLMDEAFLRGELDAPNYFDHREDYTNARWIAPGWGYIDPEAEIAASQESIRSNLSTLSDECAAGGQDWEEVAEQRAREEKKLKELGLSMPESSKVVLAGVSKNKEQQNVQEN